MAELRPRPLLCLSVLALSASVADAAPPTYATWLGGAGAERTYAAAAGPGGTIVVAGRTLSPAFPFTAGQPIAPVFASPPQAQPFVARLDPAVPGPAGLLFADYLGGALGDGGGEARGVAVDGAGNIYVVGFHTGHSLPIVHGLGPPADHNNAFLVKLAPDGHTILFSTYLGGSNNVDELDEIVVDDSGVATVAGRTASNDFPVEGGLAGPPPNGLFDAVVMRIDTTLSGNDAILWSTCFGGHGDDAALSVAVGPGGRVYVTGTTSSYAVGGKIPLTANAVASVNAGGDDAFVAVLDPSIAGPAQLVYGSYLGGQFTEEAGAIDVDAAGAAFVTGATMSPNFPVTAGAWDATLDQTFGPGARTDGYVAKLDPFAGAGATLVWSTFLGGSQNELPRDLEVDGSGRPLVAGSEQSPDFPLTACSAPRDASTSAFVARFGATGQLERSLAFGGGGTDLGEGLALLAGGRVALVGTSSSPTLPVTAGAVQAARAGADDTFVAVLWDCESCPPGLGLDGGVCAPCAPGSASPDGGACRPCAAGTFAAGAGSVACEPCACGTSSADGASACDACPAGSASADGASCAACPAGTVAPEGACACAACPPGAVPDAAQAGCAACPPGSAPDAAQTSCEACAPGTYSVDGVSCAACPPGTTSSVGATACAAACAPEQLAALASPGLTPAFAPGVATYHVPASATGSTWVEATLCDPSLTLYVGGNQVASGAKVGAWLGNGSVSISLYAGWTQVGAYQLVVDPGLPEAPLAEGLASLVTAGLAPGFDPGITDYTAPVQAGWITQVTATLTDPAYTLYIDGVAVPSGTPFAAWAPPGSTIDVSVYLGWLQLGDYDVVITP